MTAPVKAKTPALLAAPPVAIPANAAKNSTPVTSEKIAQLSWRSPRNCQASTRQAVIRPRKPTPPKTICSVPCQLGGDRGAGRGADREAVSGVGDEEPGPDEASGIDTEEPAASRIQPLGAQVACYADGCGADHQPGEHEHQHVDPAEGAVSEQAPVVVGQAEASAGERLGQ
jgi:hypothetical protein